MTAVDIEQGGDRTRTWGIVFLSLLSAVLIFMLLRNPAPESPVVHTNPERASPHEAAPAPPAQESPSAGKGAYYRGWPLFEGWPLPQVPSGSNPAPQAPTESGPDQAGKEPGPNSR
jgi:hypothetical protein